jgi:hypothetical protein
MAEPKSACLGDTLTVTVYDILQGARKTETFVIVGTYLSEKTPFLVPWQTICELSEEVTGFPRHTEILRFTLADNRTLSEFKEAAAEYFSEIDVSRSLCAHERALIVYDEQFKSSLLSTQRKKWQREDNAAFLAGRAG